MPASFRKEAWENREEISTPQWQRVASVSQLAPAATTATRSSRGRQIKAKKGSSIISHLQTSAPPAAKCAEESEEDLSDESFFKMHAECAYKLRRENLLIINRVLKRKKSSAGGLDVDDTPSKELEKNFAELNKPFVMPPIPADLSAPITFNYDSCFNEVRSWKRPKLYIALAGDLEEEEEKEVEEEQEELADKEAVVAAESRKRKVAAKRSQKKAKAGRPVPGKAGGSSSHKKGKKMASRSATPQQQQVALLKLRYLHLRKQLAVLREQNLAASAALDAKGA